MSFSESFDSGDENAQNLASRSDNDPSATAAADSNVAGPDVYQLQLLIKDLTRRLQNAQLTIDAERSIARNATAQAEAYRHHLSELSKLLRLESAKAYNLEQKSLHQLESQRYESNKARAEKLHEELRLMEVDHMMSGMKREPMKLTKMRSKLQSLEKTQDSQKVFLQELVESDAVNEQLAVAAQMGDLFECSRLLRIGAWPNYVDTAGYLALHYACTNGFYDVAQLLLEFGADPSSSLTGHSPLVLAAANGHVALLKLLLSFGADIEDAGKAHTPATIAALRAGYFDAVEYLLTMGADINSFDANENTILHHAVFLEGPQAEQVIPFLLQWGSSTERVNKKGHTATQTALYQRRKRAFYALGGDPNADTINMTAAGVGSLGGGGGGAVEQSSSISRFRAARGLPAADGGGAQTMQLHELFDAAEDAPAGQDGVRNQPRGVRHGTPTRMPVGNPRSRAEGAKSATADAVRRSGSSKRMTYNSGSRLVQPTRATGEATGASRAAMRSPSPAESQQQQQQQQRSSTAATRSMSARSERQLAAAMRAGASKIEERAAERSRDAALLRQTDPSPVAAGVLQHDGMAAPPAAPAVQRVHPAAVGANEAAPRTAVAAGAAAEDADAAAIARRPPVAALIAAAANDIMLGGQLESGSVISALTFDAQK